MKEDNAKVAIKVLGIDLAKKSFQLHGVDEKSQTILKKKLTRSKLTTFVSNLEPCLIGLEACGGAHYWVRTFTNLTKGKPPALPVDY